MTDALTSSPTSSAPDGASVILYTDERVLLYKRDGRPMLFPHCWAILGEALKQENPRKKLPAESLELNSAIH